MRLMRLGKKASVETRKRQSEALSGIPRDFSWRMNHSRAQNGDKVVQKTLDGKVVKVWDYAHQVCLAGIVSCSHLHPVLKNNKKYAKGYIWEYAR